MADLTVTAEEARAMRDEHGVGLQEAKRIILRRKIKRAIAGAEDMQHVRDILAAMVELI